MRGRRGDGDPGRAGDVRAAAAGCAGDPCGGAAARLGLGYDHFIQSVLLPQGRFADFLQAESGKRQKLLVELLAFGVYKKIGQQARDRARLAAERARLALEQRAKLADATEEAEERAAARVRALEALGQAVDD
jgi:exonuclease SbcC